MIFRHFQFYSHLPFYEFIAMLRMKTFLDVIKFRYILNFISIFSEMKALMAYNNLLTLRKLVVVIRETIHMLTFQRKTII